MSQLLEEAKILAQAIYDIRQQLGPEFSSFPACDESVARSSFIAYMLHNEALAVLAGERFDCAEAQRKLARMDAFLSEKRSSFLSRPAMHLTRDQSRAVDQWAIENLGISSLVLMENAGRGTADVLVREGYLGPVVICCGSGNNGGDGLVLARHLDLRGRSVQVFVWSEPDRLSDDARANADIAERLGLLVEYIGRDERQIDEGLARLKAALSQAAWAVDGLLGTGSQGDPRSPYDRVIEAMNAASVRRLALDVPSGLDCETGKPSASTFLADLTCTYASLKVGYREASADSFLGRVEVVDIGLPERAIRQAAGLSDR
jgi:NAD(P)H-hydrate epimerase